MVFSARDTEPSLFLISVMTITSIMGTGESSFYFTVPFCGEDSISLLLVPLEPREDGVVVLVTIGSTIQEFLVNGRRGSHVLVHDKKCTWNTTNESSGITVKTPVPAVLYVETRGSTFIVPARQSLGENYTLLTFWNETLLPQNGLESWFVISAPSDITTVFINSEDVKQFSSSFHVTWFHKDSLYRFLLNEGDSLFVRCKFDVSGIKINGSKPIFVAMGTIYREEVRISVAPPRAKWGQKYFTHDSSSFRIVGDHNTSLRIRTSTNTTKVYQLQSSPVSLSLFENKSSPILLEFSKPVLLLQRLLTKHHNDIIYAKIYVTPVSMYTQTDLFSNDTEFVFRKLSVCPSDDFLSNSTETSHEIFTIEKERFSSLTVYSDESQTHTLVKEFKRTINSRVTFSGYIHCRPNRRFYAIPAAKPAKKPCVVKHTMT